MATNAITHKRYLEKLKEKKAPTRPLENYKNALHPIKHSCTKCSTITKLAPQYYLGKKNPTGCPNCVRKGRPIDGKRALIYPEKLLNRFNGLIVLTKKHKIIAIHKKLEHKCLVCSTKFEVEPYSILRAKYGCPNCSNKIIGKKLGSNNVKTHREYVVELQEKVLPFLPLSLYLGTDVAIKHICDKGHKFLAKPRALFEGKQCPNCRAENKVSNYSQACIKWLSYIELTNDIKLRHAEYKGEKIIHTKNGKTYRCDGYYPKTKTIYEFYGDATHGNPKKFKPDSCPCWLKPDVTAKELYRKTLQREKILKKAGYNMVTIWERQWNKVYSTLTIEAKIAIRRRILHVSYL